MTHQIAYNRPIFTRFFGSRPMRDFGSLHDAGVVSHVIDHPHKPVIKHWTWHPKNLVERGYRASV
jgi:hypothetical protein